MHIHCLWVDKLNRNVRCAFNKVKSHVTSYILISQAAVAVTTVAAAMAASGVVSRREVESPPRH